MNKKKLLELKTGTVVAERYKVLELIGQGAMGNIYLVNNKEIPNKKFVIKVLRKEIADNEEIISRFRNEMLTGLIVTHPNIAKTYEFIEEKVLVAYVMDYIPGSELRDIMEEQGQLDVLVALKYLEQICKGTSALHKNGIIHRDIKPENIRINEKGILKIMDFGVSILDMKSRMSEAGTILGTTDYLAPEYIIDGEVSELIDIYAMGIIAYEMLTNSTPFSGKTVYQEIEYKVKQDPRSPEEFREDLPYFVSNFILKMIARDPKERFQSCEEVLDEIYRVGTLPSDYNSQSIDVSKEIHDAQQENDQTTKEDKNLDLSIEKRKSSSLAEKIKSHSLTKISSHAIKSLGVKIKSSSFAVVLNRTEKEEDDEDGDEYYYYIMIIIVTAFFIYLGIR